METASEPVLALWHCKRCLNILVGHIYVRLCHRDISSDKARTGIRLKGSEEEKLVGMGCGQKLGVLEMHQSWDNIKKILSKCEIGTSWILLKVCPHHLNPIWYRWSMLLLHRNAYLQCVSLNWGQTIWVSSSYSSLATAASLLAGHRAFMICLPPSGKYFLRNFSKGITVPRNFHKESTLSLWK